MKQFGAFVLDTANQCLWNQGAQIALQPKPFAVLRYLVENPGRLVTHDELLDKLWPKTFVQPQVLRTYMLELRKILGDDPLQPRFIQTLPKRGYWFVAPVTEGAGRQSSLSSVPAPLPGASCLAQASYLVGRDKELAQLGAELPQVRAGERRVIFLSGDAGIGKTSLSDAFSRAAARGAAGEEFAVARGQCVPGFEKEPFYPVLEALSRLCASPDSEAACRALSRLAPEWLVPLGRHDSAAAHELMPGNLCAALEEVAAAKPLLLVLEDLQWADGAALNLVSALARRRAPARLMVLATMRSRSEVPELKRLRQDLMLQHVCRELVLAPLGKSAIAELLSRELKQEELPPRLGPFVQLHAEGNPLFAISILNHLKMQKLLVQGEAGEWGLAADFNELSAGVPDELAQMVELEIDRLPGEDQRILEAGSLMNVVFPAWAVGAALERDGNEVEDACARLARKLHFVLRAGQDELPDGSSSGCYAFSHGIYREVLWLRQGAVQRGRRHLRIADRLGQLFAGRDVQVAEQMAMHYEAAGSWQRGIDALCAAAHLAIGSRAHTLAAELLERALGIAEQHPEAHPQLRALRDELSALQAIAAAPRQGKKAAGNLTLS